MKEIDFTQAVYRLNVKDNDMWIDQSTLAQVVRDSAETTTSPRGVEPKLHIEERDGEWQLRMWGPCGNGNSFVDSFESEEEAEQRWLELTYEYDYKESELPGIWFYSADKAIEDYVEYSSEDDDEEPVTIESVKAKLEKCDAEHAEKVEFIKQNDIKTYRDGIEIYEKTGTISKKLRRICSTILYDSIRSCPWEHLIEIQHDEEFKNEVRNFYKTVICNK